MLPIGDDNRGRTRAPLVTWALIIANILVFILFQGFGMDQGVVYSCGLVPQEIVSGKDVVTEPMVMVDRASGERYQLPGLGVTPFSVYLTILVSMFMHGGIAHIAGNLLFLSIFGDNVEDRLGHFRFLFFYLVSGAIAAAAHVAVCLFTGRDMLVPTLGASGAISAVMGAYLRLFPGNRIRVLVFNFIPVSMHAVFVIGLWFVFQLTNGLGYLGGLQGDSVAYAAHIGGFIFGFLTIKSWAPAFRYRRGNR